jgi:TonB family protein
MLCSPSMRPCLLVCGLVLGLISAAPGSARAGNQIDAAALEALRTAGSTQIVPDDETAAAIEIGTELVTTLEVCVTAKGKVKSATVVVSSGVASYDAQVAQTVKATWRFRPYKRKKQAIAVCTTAVLTYVQPPPPPPPQTQPTAPASAQPKVDNIAPSALEAVRITGNRNIVPDHETKVEIQKAGKHRLVIPVKLCIAETGVVRRVQILKSSGFPDYDAKIKRTIETWTYTPVVVDGVAKRVCSAITLIYVQRN